jgi:hypothetical protein
MFLIILSLSLSVRHILPQFVISLRTFRLPLYRKRVPNRKLNSIILEEMTNTLMTASHRPISSGCTFSRVKMDQSTQVDFPIVVRKMRRHNTSADLFVATSRGHTNSWVSYRAPHDQSTVTDTGSAR